MKAVLTSYPEMDYGRQRSNSWYSRLGAQLKRSSESFSKVGLQSVFFWNFKINFFIRVN